jgi:hypothetical protein
MRYTPPMILNSSKAAVVIESSLNKANPIVMDNLNDPSSLGSTAAYEADE